ncbi:MAG: hypothetical protein AAGD38_05390 [Acidobacteriota bacterium]
MIRFLPLALLLVTAVPIHGQEPAADALAEYARLDATRFRADCQHTLIELYDQAGDLGGYATGVWELIHEFNLESLAPEVLEASHHHGLLGRLDARHEASIRAFWDSTVGERVLWSRRLAIDALGERGFARSGGLVAERIPEARLERVRAFDEASGDTQSAVEVADLLLGLVLAAAEQVATATDEPPEIAASPEKVHRWIDGPYRDALFLRLVYRLSRLGDGELDELLAFARSEAGQVFFAARRGARLDVATQIIEALSPEQSSLLAAELWEFMEEREEEDEGDDPG